MYMYNWNESDSWGWSVQPNRKVNIESMFNNGKGLMLRTTDIFLVRVGMRGEFGGGSKTSK